MGSDFRPLGLLVAILLSRGRVGGDGLPAGSVIIGYSGTEHGASPAVAAAQRGVNVVLWSFVELISVDGEPRIKEGISKAVVSEARQALQEMGLPTAHGVSVGGWDAAHPNTTWSGETWFRVLDDWAVDEDGNRLFDGIDWDVEGYDAPGATLPEQLLRLMGDMSVSAKEAGYFVSMAPAQSYLDVNTPEFNYRLDNVPERPWHEDFPYQGRNNYCFLLAAYPGAFDLVSVQLYETWSPANYAVLEEGANVPDYLVDWAERLNHGYEVNFPAGLRAARNRLAIPPRCRVPAQQLVVGLIANPTLSEKVLFIDPSDVETAWESLEAASQPVPRGAMFWNIANDGVLANMSAGLNAFLHTRGDVPWEQQQASLVR